MKNQPTNRDLQGSISELKTELQQSIQEVLQTMNSFAQSTENRFVAIESTMATKTDLADLETRMASKDDLVNLELRMVSKDDLAKLKVRMVTKEYLDEKLYDLRGDLVQITRKQIAQKFARD